MNIIPGLCPVFPLARGENICCTIFLHPCALFLTFIHFVFFFFYPLISPVLSLIFLFYLFITWNYQEKESRHLYVEIIFPVIYQMCKQNPQRRQNEKKKKYIY